MARNRNMLGRGTKTTGGVRTNNRWEYQWATKLEAEGYTVLRRGWPDLLAFNDEGEVRFIEVKPPGNYKGLSPSQKQMAEALSRVGISVELVKGIPC